MDTFTVSCWLQDSGDEERVDVVLKYHEGHPEGYRTSDGAFWDDDPEDMEIVEVLLNGEDILPALDSDQIESLTREALARLREGND